MFTTTSLKEILPNDIYNNFKETINNIQWFSGVPGGFLSNSPKRRVRCFGGEGDTYWTAAIKHSSITLCSETTPLPHSFKKIIPYLTKLFKDKFKSARITPDTFSLAICNYYNEPDTYIAAHTDDNIWYPRECDEGPVFASLTFYPEGTPKYLHRFGVKDGGVWKGVDLGDDDVLVMPSSIEHRVLPYLKRHYSYFKPRINITFRSVYPKVVNPLLHTLAISNHTRYYGIPKCLIIRNNTKKEVVDEIKKYYSTFCKSINKPFSVIIADIDRKRLIKEYKQKYGNTIRMSSNITGELLREIET